MCLCGSSYKEQSGDETDSDDLIEVEYSEAMMEEETAECIEKVLDHRTGKKGGILFLYELFNVYSKLIIKS